MSTTRTVGNGYSTLQAAASAAQAGDIVNMVAKWSGAGFKLSSVPTTAPVTFDLSQGTINAPYSGGTTGIDIEAAGNAQFIIGTITGMPTYGLRLVQSNGVSIKGGLITKCGTNLYFSHGSNITVDGTECSFATVQHGIYFANSLNNVLCQNVKTHDNAGCGVHSNADLTQGKPGISTNMKFLNNWFYNNCKTNGGSGLNLAGNQEVIIANNLFFGNYSKAIGMYISDGGTGTAFGPKNTTIVNNTIIAISATGAILNTIQITDDDGGNVAFNNILIGTNTAFGTAKSSNNVLSSKVVFGMFVSVSTPPLPTDNFALATGSPAIGAGVASFSGQTAPTTDLNGNSATVPPSCGAIQGGTTPPPNQILTSITLASTPTNGAYPAIGLDQNGQKMNPAIPQTSFVPNVSAIAGSATAAASAAGAIVTSKAVVTLSVSFEGITSNAVTVGV